MDDKQPQFGIPSGKTGLVLDDRPAAGRAASASSMDLQGVSQNPPAPPPEKAKPKARMGDRLLELGAITPDQLDVALREKSRSPEKMVGSILVEFGFITDDVLTRLLAESTGFEAFNIREALIDPDAVKLVPRNVALQYRVLPISISDEKAVVAMADPFDVLAMDQLRRYLPRGVQIEARVSMEDDLVNAIDVNFGYEMSVNGILRELE
ncbi:MAG: type II/IV secretion system protein, partial [Alphaproteobacteria bacterium]|nr:type II/IV secretion system protein [Alphaproteobacteria bacterium]